MNHTAPRRSHLVERAVEAARTAALAEATGPGHPERAPLSPAAAHALLGEVTAGPPPTLDLPVAGQPDRSRPAPIARDVLERAGLVADSPVRVSAREEIALVREQILRAIESSTPTQGHEARILLVTSARSGEGKSFTALNLAASMAEGAGRPVVLVDAQGRAGSLTERLGLTRSPGLEALRGADAPDPALLPVATAVNHLSVLPFGSGPPAQGDAIAAGLLRLAAQLPRHIFVVDAPACLEASIAGLLAATAGQVLMVVQAERTQRTEVEAALDIVDACPNLQLLLNRVMLTVSGSFGERMARPDDTADREQS